MLRSLCCWLCLASVLMLATPAQAQDPVPQPIMDEPIGRYVVDARGLLPKFKANAAIAEALAVETADLPTWGLGLVVGAHVYPVRKGHFALGIGGELLLRARASSTVPPAVEDGPDGPTIVTSLTGISPQLSLNFGKRDGFSYLTGGIGRASYTSEIEDLPFEDPESRPRAFNYGGGARWFTSRHVAFTIDLRFYAIQAQEATLGRPAFPSMTIMVFSAGIAGR